MNSDLSQNFNLDKILTRLFLWIDECVRIMRNTFTSDCGRVMRWQVSTSDKSSLVFETEQTDDAIVQSSWLTMAELKKFPRKFMEL